MKILLPVAAVVLAVLFAAFKFSRGGYETAAYEVRAQDGPFEIREYAPMMLASTPMDRDAGEDGSFLRLFRYISGDNAAEQKIAMTTPVLMTGEDGGRMSFIAPRELAAAGVPAATSEEIRLEPMDGGRFAAFRFSGSSRREKYEEAERKLAEWIRRQGLESVGEPISAGYDPPFTPPFLRRNEILIRLAEPVTAANR